MLCKYIDILHAVPSWKVSRCENSNVKKAISKRQYVAVGMKSRPRRRDNYKVKLSLSRRTASSNYFIVFVDLFSS